MSDGGSIDWERGWVAPEGALPLIHDAWLPEAELFQHGGSGVVTLEDVRAVPALVLLGEPGSGKSECLRRESTITEEATKADGDEVLLVDLGLAMDARELRERVFEGPKFVAWRNGTGRLHLYLDSLDEAKVQIRKVVSLLEEGLGHCDIRRLVLRVACRTADRPLGFEQWLQGAFGEGRVRTLELAPLRLSETSAMAASGNVDATRFVQDAINAGVAPLAARPLSLKMLLRVFAAEGGFPDTLAALYHDALLLMVGEEDEERRAQRSHGRSAAPAPAAERGRSPRTSSRTTREKSAPTWGRTRADRSNEPSVVERVGHEAPEDPDQWDHELVGARAGDVAVSGTGLGVIILLMLSPGRHGKIMRSG
ncbi:MAG TPA: hypothetical protein VI318_14305 [Baekduia sp.]